MSSIYDPSPVTDTLNKLIEEYQFSDDIRITFITSSPRSDMGKGTVVAHLLNFLKNSDALKFDGTLNTNFSRRHTVDVLEDGKQRGHDDFETYERYNPERTFREEHYILAGNLFKEFIEKYGEGENLCFRPHFTKYFVFKIFEYWNSLGKPRELIVEIGGTLSDLEVDPYVTPAVRFFKNKYGNNCKIILISELGFNGKYIKTKTAQLAIDSLHERIIIPDAVFLREPAELSVCSIEEKNYNLSYTIKKFTDIFGYDFEGKLFLIPHYPKEKIDELGTFLKVNIFNKIF